MTPIRSFQVSYIPFCFVASSFFARLFDGGLICRGCPSSVTLCMHPRIDLPWFAARTCVLFTTRVTCFPVLLLISLQGYLQRLYNYKCVPNEQFCCSQKKRTDREKCVPFLHHSSSEKAPLAPGGAAVAVTKRHPLPPHGCHQKAPPT